MSARLNLDIRTVVDIRGGTRSWRVAFVDENRIAFSVYIANAISVFTRRLDPVPVFDKLFVEFVLHIGWRPALQLIGGFPGKACLLWDRLGTHRHINLMQARTHKVPDPRAGHRTYRLTVHGTDNAAANRAHPRCDQCATTRTADGTYRPANAGAVRAQVAL